jgi:hypothetical protein
LAAVAKTSGVEIRVLPSEGSKQNLAWLAAGRADLALAQSDIAWNAYSGKGGFLKPVTSLRVIAPLYTEAVHILVRQTLYIHRVEDLRGKRVAVGPAGSGTEANATQLLGTAGLTLAEIDPRHLSVEEAMAGLRRADLDAAFVTSGVPSEVVTGVLRDRSATLLEPDQNFLERLRRIFPFYLTKNIETSDYPHLDEQVTTAGVQALLVGRKDLPEAVIDHLVQALSSKRLKRYHLSTPDEGDYDLDLPIFEMARDHYTSQAQRHRYELIATAVLLTSLAFAILYWRHKHPKPRRRNDHRFHNLIIAFLIIWFLGSFALFRIEHRINDNYASFGRSLWSGLITIYSLSNKEPLTFQGRLVGIAMLVLGLGSLIWLAERVAAFYIEKKLMPLIRSGFFRMHKMKDHYVIIGWNEKGFGIIEQLQGGDLKGHVQIVILAPEKIEGLPQGPLVQPWRGDPTHEDDLKKLSLQTAHSVIVLANSTKASEDARTILAILAIRKICPERKVPIVAEIIESKNVNLARFAGGEKDCNLEVVSSQAIGRGLLTQAAVHPGLSNLYDKLLELKKDNSEIHSAQIPELLVDKNVNFDDLARFSFSERSGQCVIPIAIQRGDDLFINPITRTGKLERKDVIFALCDSPGHLDALLRSQWWATFTAQVPASAKA